jgi:hypothetical protein
VATILVRIGKEQVKQHKKIIRQWSLYKVTGPYFSDSISFKKRKVKQGIMVHACNPRTQNAKAGRLSI